MITPALNLYSIATVLSTLSSFMVYILCVFAMFLRGRFKALPQKLISLYLDIFDSHETSTTNLPALFPKNTPVAFYPL